MVANDEIVERYRLEGRAATPLPSMAWLLGEEYRSCRDPLARVAAVSAPLAATQGAHRHLATLIIRLADGVELHMLPTANTPLPPHGPM